MICAALAYPGHYYGGYHEIAAQSGGLAAHQAFEGYGHEAYAQEPISRSGYEGYEHDEHVDYYVSIHYN